MTLLVADKENLRIRLDSRSKREWDELCERKQITQQAALANLIDWFRQQDDASQSVILGQLEPSPDLIELILRRMSGAKGKAGRVRPPGTGAV